MTIHRYAAKRDASERPIIDALERAGARVLQLDTFDLLIWYRGHLYMQDAKTGKGRATMTQARLIQEGWPLVLVNDPIAALKAIGADARPLDGRSDRQPYRIHQRAGVTE